TEFHGLYEKRLEDAHGFGVISPAWTAREPNMVKSAAVFPASIRSPGFSRDNVTKDTSIHFGLDGIFMRSDPMLSKDRKDRDEQILLVVFSTWIGLRRSFTA